MAKEINIYLKILIPHTSIRRPGSTHHNQKNTFTHTQLYSFRFTPKIKTGYDDNYSFLSSVIILASVVL